MFGYLLFGRADFFFFAFTDLLLLQGMEGTNLARNGLDSLNQQHQPQDQTRMREELSCF